MLTPSPTPTPTPTQTPTPTPRETPQHEHPPLYNSWWALAFKKNWRSTLLLRLSSGRQHRHGEASRISISTIHHLSTAYHLLHWKRNGDQHFHFRCRAEVNIAMEKRLQFRRATVQQVMPILTRHPHQKHNPWLAPRGYLRESTMFWLVGAVLSILYMASTAGLYISYNTITIQQDCVSPSDERLTGSQAGGSQQHNRLPSLGIRPWLVPPMAWADVWEEHRTWHGLASVICFLFVVSPFFNGFLFGRRDNVLQEC